MKIIRIHNLFIIAVLMLLAATSLCSQQFISKGKEFWFGFMTNDESREITELTVYITSTTNTSGTLEVPLQNFTRNFTVPANSTISISIPESIGMAIRSETAEKRAVHVTAKDLVTVYALNYAPQTSDAAIILPVQTLGKEYYVQAYSKYRQSELLIVPVSGNTRVEITPTDMTENNKPWAVPFTVTLNRGEVYQVRSKEGGDLTGTRVRVLSGDSIAVFGGSNCSYVGACDCCCNHLFDQMFPVRLTGMKEFITVPYQTRRGDLFRIIAFYDSTLVTVDGKTPAYKLNAGDFQEIYLANPSFIQSNKPVSVAQYSRSRECDGVMNSDPFYINLCSNDMALDNITFNAFYSNIIENYFVNIISPTAYVDSVFYDGVRIGNQFKIVPTKPEYSYAQIATKSGDHTLKSSGGVIAYVYAYGERESYGYSTGINVFGTFSLFDCPPAEYATGDTISYPIFIQKTPFIQTTGNHNYRTRLKFNRNLLRPILDSTMTYNDDGILSIKSIIQDLETPATLKEVKFKAMLGDSACTTIEIDSMGWDEYNFEAKARCEVCIKLCEADGKRLILSTDSLAMSMVYPNPVNEIARLDYVLIENGQTELYITDLLGNVIEVLFSGNAKAGSYNAYIKAMSLESGMYYCVLKTPSGMITQKISVNK